MKVGGFFLVNKIGINAAEVITEIKIKGWKFCGLLKFNKNIIVTTGNNTPNILANFFKKNLNDKINLIENINFTELEFIIHNSSLLISCHGAVSHVASAKCIQQIDIIDKSYNYIRWTKHFRNYKSLNRKSFNKLSTEILNLDFI